MSNVVKLRPFKFPKHRLVESDFIPSRLDQNTKFMEEDLARSGLTPDDIGAWVHGWLALPANYTAGYVIGYTHPDGTYVVDAEGELLMWRIRLESVLLREADRRYDQPTAKELRSHNLSTSPCYIPPAYHLKPKTDVLAICEGEKKAAAVMKYLDVSAIGIGGCWNWRDRNTGEVDPWIRQVAPLHKDIWIVPDGDYRRYDISKAYGTFCSELTLALESVGWEGSIRIVDCPGKIDDLILEWGPEAASNFAALDFVHPNDLVEDPASLAKKYSLGYKETDKGVRVHENTSNIQRLMEGHPGFARIWHNDDTDEMMVGDQPFVEGKSNMDFANYFQHNLGMPTVKHNAVLDVMEALAREDHSSPFLDWVNSLVWDGEHRLDTFLIRHLGVADTPYAREVTRKFLVGSVGRQREPGCKMDWMMVMSGPQGVGKSMMPRLLFRDMVTEIVGDHGARDTVMKIHTSLCTVLDELDALNNKEVEYWKSMLSTSVDVYRSPYARKDIRKPRRSVMYGTTNEKYFLQEDATGYRRYMVLEATKHMDWDAFREEVPQLWAEASVYHRGGESFGSIETATQDVAEQFVSEDEDLAIVTSLLRAQWLGRSKEFCHVDGKTGEDRFLITGPELRMLLEPYVDASLLRHGKRSRRLQNHMHHLGFERYRGTHTSTGKAKPWICYAPGETLG